jgi:hypothetical protein
MSQTLFHFLAEYSSLKVFFIGIISTTSFLGVGKYVFERIWGRKFAFYFLVPISTLLGIHIYSSALQLLGFFSIATPFVLKSVFYTQILAGNFLFALAFNKKIARSDLAMWQKDFSASRGVLVLVVLILLSLFVNLIISLAPSTKFDEIYYHMLMPLRMFQDNSIEYYRLPWHIFIPHMHYQILAAPFYAIGLTDALNVVSWGVSVTFVFFLVGVLFSFTRNLFYSLLVALGMYTGMHSPVWYVTGGAGATSVLAMTMLVYLLVDGKRFFKEWGALKLLGIISFLSMATAASKLSYLPISFLCLTICAFLVWRRFGYTRFCTVFCVSASFWMIFYFPAFVWSWCASGYMLGPMADPINTVSVLSSIQDHRSFAGAVYEVVIALLELTPVVWGGFFLFFVVPWTRKAVFPFSLAVILLALQIVLFIWKLPLHFRYFGGLHLGLALFFWSSGLDEIRKRLALIQGYKKVIVRALITLCVIPWFCLQVFYSAQFFPVVFGSEPVRFFAERLIPFYTDFEKLDELLPEDAVLFVRGIKMPVYSPRRFVYEQRDLSFVGEHAPVFLFASSRPDNDEWSEYILEPFYTNKTAKFLTFRTPGVQPSLSELTVYRVAAKKNDAY